MGTGSFGVILAMGQETDGQNLVVGVFVQGTAAETVETAFIYSVSLRSNWPNVF